jgi:DNA ligase D-like protein (predicted ligase)
MPKVPRKPASMSPLAFIPPLKPKLSAKPPEGAGWLHEIKLDGYRTELIVRKGEARAFTMNGHDWTDRYCELVKAAAKLKCKSAILDGEAVVQDEKGRPDFHALRHALFSAPHRVIFFAFDLLHLDGKDLRKLPLVERRARLAKLLGQRRIDDPIQLSEAIEGSGTEVFKAAEQMGLEGIVSKRKQSRYESGISQAWLKTKCTEENEFVVVGAEPNTGCSEYGFVGIEC